MTASQVATSLFWSPDLVDRFVAASGPADAIRMVGGLLVKAGAVTPEHVEAAVQRELEHPTGLPARIPFALVHTDSPGALLPAASIGIFERPVPFRRMDDPNEVLQVPLVVMLSVPERHMQAELLSRLITALARSPFAERLVHMNAAEAFRSLMEAAA